MTAGHDRNPWRPTLALGALGALAAIGPVAAGVDEDSVRSAIRATAGLAAVVFTVVFATSSLHALANSGVTKWLLRNRRALGVGFAAIQGIHLVVVLALAFGYAESFWARTPITSIVGGGVGYVVLAAMTITSFDGTTRALGRRAWTILHTTGMYVLWGIFAFSYVAQPLTSAPYVAIVVLLFGALTMRAVVRVQRTARRLQRRAPA